MTAEETVAEVEKMLREYVAPQKLSKTWFGYYFMPELRRRVLTRPESREE